MGLSFRQPISKDGTSLKFFACHEFLQLCQDCLSERGAVVSVGVEEIEQEKTVSIVLRPIKPFHQ
jgi:hypothetical protein